MLQDLRLKHVDPGVDRVGEDLAPRRLLEEALDTSLLVRDDDAELQRVVDGLQTDGHGRFALLVEGDDLREVIREVEEEVGVGLVEGQLERGLVGRFHVRNVPEAGSYER